MSVNLRRHIRKSFRLNALLVSDDGEQSQACTLLDISESGARISLKDTKDVPEHFTIVLSWRGVPYRICRLVWRGDTDIGVTFEAEIPSDEWRNRRLQPDVSLKNAVIAFGHQP
jgi:hypothetical protein